VPQAAIDDLRARLKQARWPEDETVKDWSQGVPARKLRPLMDYWANSYDWRRCEAKINALPNFRTTIDGLGIHFIHRRSARADALPLIMTHGWPGSIVEFLDVVNALAEPEDDGLPAFHVVAPSLPGYGFSDKPTATGWNYERTADAWVMLMRRLGYGRFVAQGGDWGAVVTAAIGAKAAPEVAGIHLNMGVVYPTPEMGVESPKEQAMADKLAWYFKYDSGYMKLQNTRPQTLGYALADSPIGQAAWIYEKCHAWTDNKGDPEDALSQDQMLDNISVYWFTNTGASSARFYWELGNGFVPKDVYVPCGFSNFPAETLQSSRRWTEQFYKKIVHWNELPRGGHFAAWEEPDLFVTELRTCFGRPEFR
jgi:pimeloyl-ACP methyl ester carboxylesterase